MIATTANAPVTYSSGCGSIPLPRVPCTNAPQPRATRYSAPPKRGARSAPRTQAYAPSNGTFGEGCRAICRKLRSASTARAYALPPLRSAAERVFSESTARTDVRARYHSNGAIRPAPVALSISYSFGCRIMNGDSAAQLPSLGAGRLKVDVASTAGHAGRRVPAPQAASLRGTSLSAFSPAPRGRTRNGCCEKTSAATRKVMS
mmetsp:Transcript_3405/g.9862  ORF Transcript_3405/g.9862 Transcript_3405/m.9862 type:complete len:204 (+) Transcript_3405:184-795(+)